MISAVVEVKEMPSRVFIGDWGREERGENYHLNQGKLTEEEALTRF